MPKPTPPGTLGGWGGPPQPSFVFVFSLSVVLAVLLLVFLGTTQRQSERPTCKEGFVLLTRAASKSVCVQGYHP